MPAGILDRIRASENLPSPPAVALKVLELTRNDSASVDELAAVIQNDPALTAKILKVVNSPLFGVSREVTSIKQAMNLMGRRTVRVMVLSFSLVDVMNDGRLDAFDYKAYWRHSLTTAVAGRLLAQAVGSRLTEEAFVAGLLSNIGRLAAVRCAPDEYAPVLAEIAAAPDRSVHEIEASVLGVTHAEMGRLLLAGWGLPDSLCDAVGAHHGERLGELPATSRELASIVHCAARISGVFCQDLPSQQLNAVKQACRAEIGVPESVLEHALSTLDEQVKAAADTLSLQIGRTVNYAQLQSEAMTRLASLSMQAEVERAATAQREQSARRDADRLEQERWQILEAASTDSLTKVGNRAAFDQRLAEEITAAAARGGPIGLIMLDVDHFKAFNDAHGHQAGDEVLRAVGAAIDQAADGVGFAARYGGEEFAVIVGRRTRDAVLDLANEIRRAIESIPVMHKGRSLRVTASVGVACVDARQSGVTPEQVIESADRGLYTAKRRGRNRVEASA